MPDFLGRRAPGDVVQHFCKPIDKGVRLAALSGAGICDAATAATDAARCRLALVLGRFRAYLADVVWVQ
jgi:hypothetical protein